MGEIVNVHHLARLLGPWSNACDPLTISLTNALRDLVRTGRLPAGSRLPSERQLATAIGLARTTVGLAFDVLRGEGTLRSRTGVGTFVSSAGCGSAIRGDARLQSFLDAAPRDRIDLRSAAVCALPMVGEEFDRLSYDDVRPLLGGHGYVPEGLPALREAVADYYRRDGLSTSPDEILVTTGAQQAVHIVAGHFLEAGDLVVVEEPTYRGGIEALRKAGGRLVSVPSGDDGVDVTRLADVLERHRPKMALILSTAHNPTGSCLDAARRAEVGRLCDAYGVTLIDDASTSDTLCRAERPLPLAAFCSRTITVGSASKLFWGGLRIGWIRAEKRLLASLVATKSALDLGTSIPSQITTGRLLSRTVEARAQRRRQLDAARADVSDWIRAMLPAWHVHPSQGGASLWIRLPGGRSATQFSELAKRAHVDILAGPTFSTANRCDDHVRIAFPSEAASVMAGIERMAADWHRHFT